MLIDGCVVRRDERIPVRSVHCPGDRLESTKVISSAWSDLHDASMPALCVRHGEISTTRNSDGPCPSPVWFSLR